MKPFGSRQVIQLLLAFAVGAGSLLVAGSALADTALFRVEQAWHNFPNPAVTSPGGAGLYQGYLQPYVTRSPAKGYYVYPPATAIVEPNNPIGGAFTLPQGFIDVQFTNTITPKTGWLGYTTTTYSNYYNGPGVFKPNNVHTGSTPSRLVFPTTLGNPYPNYGIGNPNLPTVGGGLCKDGNPPPGGGGCGTTTFDGLYDFTRAGSINVTPGPRQFGGTFRAFYRPESFWNQYIYLNDPAFYNLYAEFSCLNNGVVCTPGNHKSNIGDLTAVYRGVRYLLNVKGSGTGDRLQSRTAKATTPTTPYGNNPTSNGAGTPTGSGPASFISGVQQYVGLIHPFTTGFASVKNPIGSPNVINPQRQGYDITLSGADITVLHYDYNQQWNQQELKLTTTTYAWPQEIQRVGRVVSMVRPRLIHTYETPLDPTAKPITTNWQVARMHSLKVYFVPEPIGMLLLGTGIAALLGLSRIRRR